MAFNFSSTAGTSGITTITISATSNSFIESLVNNFTLSNSNGHSVMMAVAQRAYEPLGKYISFEPSDIVWDASGGTGSLHISSNDDWVITSNGWITLSRFEEARETVNTLSGNGNTIVGIRCGENTGATRNGSITGYCASDSSITASTTVSQNGNYVAPYIIVDGEYIADASGETAIASVSANTTWYAMTSDRWIDLQTLSGSGDGSITFIVDPNTSDFDRSANITVYNYEDDVYTALKVFQPKNSDKPYIIINPMSFNVASSGSSNNTISISANCEYDIAADTQWITLDASSGSGNGSVSFSTTPNIGASDNGNIVFSNSALSRTVTVQREGVKKYLSANTSTLSFAMSGGSGEIVVYSNINWVASVNTYSELADRWISITPSNGSGNASIRVDVTSGDTNRNASIVIYSEKYGLNWSVNVNQYSNKTIVYTSTDGNIVTPNNLPNIVSNTYEDGVGVIVCSNAITQIPYGAFTSATTLETIILPDSLVSIGDFAFDYCTGMTGNVYIPSSVTEIGAWAFYRCWNIESINIPYGITTLKGLSFSQLFNVTAITIPSSVTKIEDSAMITNGLTTLEIPSSVTTIGQMAFMSNHSLSSVTINNSTRLPYRIFFDCDSLSDIYCNTSTAPYISSSGNYAFEGTPSDVTVHIPSGANYNRWKSDQYAGRWTYVEDL